LKSARVKSEALDGARLTLIQGLMHHGGDYTPYEGMEMTGWPVKTLLRGALVVDNGEIVGAPGMGQFQARRTTQSPGSA
jgi:dihydropyrimidinase